jgi:hypothetical protein
VSDAPDYDPSGCAYRLELRLVVYEGCHSGRRLRAIHRGPLPMSFERNGEYFVPVLEASLWDLRDRLLEWPDLAGWRVTAQVPNPLVFWNPHVEIYACPKTPPPSPKLSEN